MSDFFSSAFWASIPDKPSTFPPDAHNILSASHGDTLADSVLRGDLIVGNATPKWARLPLGSIGKIPISDGSDLVYRLLVASDIPNLDTSKLTTGTLAVARGGTNLGSYTTGDILYASDSGTLAGLAAGALGKYLMGQGASTASAYVQHDAVRCSNTGNENINNNSFTALTFDTEQYDNNGMHSLLSNLNRITIQTAGEYLIEGFINWTANGTGIRSLKITKNSGLTLLSEIDSSNIGSANSMYMQITAKAKLAVNDYIELYVYQNSGAALACQAGGSGVVPSFGAAYIGAG